LSNTSDSRRVDINQVSISGNLVRAPELRGNNGRVCAMRIASNERVKRQDTEEWYTHTNFIDVIAFGREAERCAQALSQGSHVVVAGKVKFREYDDTQQPGRKRSVIEIHALNVQFMDRGGLAQQPAPGAGQYQTPGYTPPVPGMVPGMQPAQMQQPGQPIQPQPVGQQPVGQPQPIGPPPSAPPAIPPAAQPVGAGTAGAGNVPW